MLFFLGMLFMYFLYQIDYRPLKNWYEKTSLSYGEKLSSEDIRDLGKNWRGE